MSIEEFLNGFNNIIPYEFKLKIGGPKAASITSKSELISSENRKGKGYPVHRRNLLGDYTDYVSIDKLDLPIELTVQCSHPHTLKWEKSSKTTNKSRTYFQVRVLREDDKRQCGYLSLDLTAAGDVDHKFCSFYSEDRSHEIMQSIRYEYDEQTKKVIPSEQLSFIFYNLESGLEEKVSFYKEDGILKGITVSKQPLKNHAFDSLVWSEEEVKEKQEFFSRYCNNVKVERARPLVCDTTNFIINKDFTGRLERIQELQSTLSSIEESKTSLPFNTVGLLEEIEHLKDPKNDIFSGFYGEYIGNTVIKMDSKLILVVETLKDGYHYFTKIDITDTDAFKVNFYYEREDDTLYYQAIENSNKKPMFRTKVENGEEVLVPLGESITDDELDSFEKFKSYCLESFGTIESKGMATLSLNRYCNSERPKTIKMTMASETKK